MTWVRVSDDFMDHPKIVGLGADAPIALTLWLAGLGYCNRYLTDGFLPAAVLPRLTTLDPGQLRQATEALIDAGLWQRAVNGYEVHDYLVYQHSKEFVLARRAQAHDRGVKGAAVRWRMDGAIDDSMEPSTTGAGAPKPNPNPIPNPTTSPAQAASRVVDEYVGLYGHMSPQKERWLRNIEGQWDEDRVIEGLRYEHRNGATPKDICGRLENGLKTGDQLRRVGAA
jgi:hypothetical protein